MVNYYTLLYYPTFGDNKIERFRKKHDKQHNKWEAHLTLIFPISDEKIEEKILIEHIEEVLKKWEKFDIHIKGLKESWDHWLFLILKEGNKKTIKLHLELYRGPLKKFFREDIEIIPHIGLGEFVKNGEYIVLNPKKFELDKEKFDKAYKDAVKMDFDYWSKVDKVRLEKFDGNLNHLSTVREFRLK